MFVTCPVCSKKFETEDYWDVCHKCGGEATWQFLGVVDMLPDIAKKDCDITTEYTAKHNGKIYTVEATLKIKIKE